MVALVGTTTTFDARATVPVVELVWPGVSTMMRSKKITIRECFFKCTEGTWRLMGEAFPLCLRALPHLTEVCC